MNRAMDNQKIQNMIPAFGIPSSVMKPQESILEMLKQNNPNCVKTMVPYSPLYQLLSSIRPSTPIVSHEEVMNRLELEKLKKRILVESENPPSFSSSSNYDTMKRKNTDVDKKEKKRKKIIGVGESVVDVVANNPKPIDGDKNITLDLSTHSIETLLFIISKNGKLHNLDLSNRLLGNIGFYKISRCLRTRIEMKKFILASNKIGVHGAQIIANLCGNVFKNLQCLDVSNNPIGNEGLKELVRGLVNRQYLKCLSLKNININDDGVECLSVLQKFKHLMSINLEMNLFGDKGMVFICQILSKLRNLKALYFRQNQFKYDGLKELYSVFENNIKIQSISLSNLELEDSQVETFFEALKNHTNFENIHLFKLARLDLDIHSKAMIEFFQNQKKIKYINIGDNFICECDWSFWIKVFLNNPNLENIGCRANFMSRQDVIDFAKVIPKLSKLKYIDCSDNVFNESHVEILIQAFKQHPILNANLRDNRKFSDEFKIKNQHERIQF